jgi:hypothetical protein
MGWQGVHYVTNYRGLRLLIQLHPHGRAALILVVSSAAGCRRKLATNATTTEDATDVANAVPTTTGDAAHAVLDTTRDAATTVGTTVPIPGSASSTGPRSCQALVLFS